MKPARRKRKTNDGKYAEEFVRDVFVRLQQTRLFFFTRLYDSTSAGGSPIPPQLSDYLCTFQGASLSVEVKSSVKFTSLRDAPRSYIRATQVAKGRLFYRAGGVGFFIFVSPETGSFEVYLAGDVSLWFLAKGSKKRLAAPLCTGTGREELYYKLLEVF